MYLKTFFQTTRVAVVVLMMILGIINRATGQNGCQGCPPMIINIQSTNYASCGMCDGSIDLCVVGQGPFSYAWTGPDVFTSEEEDLQNLCPGWYTVTVTDTVFTSVDTVFITKTISTYVLEDCFCTLGGVISSTPITCTNNGTATVIASGGTEPYFFQWSNGETTPSIAVTQPGMYQVTITDSDTSTYCQSVHQVLFIAPGAHVVVGIHSPEICLGKSSYIKTWVTGKAPFTYLWSNGVTTFDQTVSPTQTTVYTVTVTDGDGCTTIANAIVKVLPIPTVTITGPEQLCAGQTVKLTASGGGNGAQYSWSNGKNGPTNMVNPGTTTTYTVTVTNLNGCTATDEHTINVNVSTDTLIYGEPKFICGDSTEYFVGYDTLINENCIRQIFVYDVFITQYKYNIVWGQEEFICGSIAKIDTIKGKEVIDPTTCTRTLYWHLQTIIPFQDSIVWGQEEFICGSIAKIDTIKGKEIVDTMSCTRILYCHLQTIIPFQDSIVVGPIEFICGDTTKVFTHIDSTVYISDCARIVYKHEVRITAYAKIGITGPPQIICGDSTALFSVLDSVQFTQNCTKIEYYHQVIIAPQIIIYGNVTDVSCNGYNNGMIQVSINPEPIAVSVIWSNGISDNKITNLGPGMYTVFMKSALGCEAEKTFLITEPDPLVLEATIENPICYGSNDGLLDVQAVGGTPTYDYVWETGLNDHLQTNIGAGEYSVTVTDANGCETNETFVLTQPDSITITATIQPTSCEGLPSGAIDLTVSGGSGSFQYDWSDFSSQEDREGLSSGKYATTVTDTNGCTQQTTFSVKENGCRVWLDNYQLIVIIGRCGELPTFDFTITVTSITGQTVRTIKRTAINGGYDSRDEGNFDLSDLKRGVYIVRVVSNDREIDHVERIVIN
jgi:SprB repeat